MKVKRAIEVVLVVVLFPIAVVGLAAIAVAVSLKGLVAYLAALLGAWLLFAYVLPMLTGVMAPSEVVANIRSRRTPRTHDDGEPLPDFEVVWWESYLKKPRDLE